MHYKFLRGKMSFEEIVKAMEGMDVKDVVRKGVFDYYLHGKSINETGINSSTLTPVLHRVNANHLTGNSRISMERFLYTNDFNPNKQKVSL